MNYLYKYTTAGADSVHPFSGDSAMGQYYTFTKIIAGNSEHVIDDLPFTPRWIMVSLPHIANVCYAANAIIAFENSGKSFYSGNKIRAVVGDKKLTIIPSCFTVSTVNNTLTVEMWG